MIAYMYYKYYNINLMLNVDTIHLSEEDCT